MKRTHHRIVNMSDPTLFSIRGEDFQTTDGLAPEDRHTPDVCDNPRCSLLSRNVIDRMNRRNTGTYYFMRPTMARSVIEPRNWMQDEKTYSMLYLVCRKCVSVSSGNSRLRAMSLDQSRALNPFKRYHRTLPEDGMQDIKMVVTSKCIKKGRSACG